MTNRMKRIIRRKQRGSQYVPEPKKETHNEDAGDLEPDPSGDSDLFPQAEEVETCPPMTTIGPADSLDD